MPKRKKTPADPAQSVAETTQSASETVQVEAPLVKRERMSGQDLQDMLRQQRRETRLKERGY